MSTWETVSDANGIVVSRRGPEARVEMHRPERLNALDAAASRELRSGLQMLAEDVAVRAVLLTGAGRAFSAGADIGATFSEPDAVAQVESDMREVVTPLILTLRTMPKPVVAAVNGAAAGVGCALALACDVVLAAESAYFLLAFAQVGLTADGGSSMLVPARIGLGRALSMALLADRVPSELALSWGLADRVVADVELAGAADEILGRLAHGPTASYAATKALINQAQLSGLERQLGFEADRQATLLASDDFHGAVAAFAGKRRPDFQGR